MADYDRLFMAEELRLDGSNFIEWYLLLCEVLHANDLLDMLEEPIGDKPNASATEEEHIEWLRQETAYLQVEWLMCTCMNSNLSSQFEDLRANEIVDELKNRFTAQEIGRASCRERAYVLV